MAVDFSTKATDVSTQIDPAARLVEPPSRQGEIDALNQIGRGIGVGARTIAQYMQNKGNMDMAKRNAAFSLDLSRLQDAEDQGVSPNEIRIRGRARLQQELANNPNNEEDIMKRYSTWLNQSGYDKIATPAIQQMEINQKQIDTAVSNGFLSSNDIKNPEAVRNAIAALENYQKVVTQLEFDQKQISNKKARLDLTASERAALDKQQEDVATSGLQKVAAAGLPYWRTQYENIKKAAAAATNEQERQQIIKQGIIQLDQDYAQRTAALSGDGLAVNQAKIDQVLGPTKQLIEVYKKELSGEYDSESFDRSIKNSQASIELQTYNNMSPKAKALVATSKLFGQAASVVIAAPAAAEVANMFAQMDAAARSANSGEDSAVGRGARNKPADVLNGGADDETTTRSYFDSAKKMMKLSADGKIDEEGQVDLNNQLKSVFKSIDVYGNATESAQEFQPVIDFLADPTVGAYLSQGGKVPPEFTGRAQQVIQDGYQTQVVPLLKQELDQTYARSMKEVAPGGNLTVRVGDIVEPTMETGRFGFKLKAGVEPSREAAAAVKLMNTSAFSKVMNKMIMSNAHMQGNTDYNKSYEQLAPTVLGTGEGEQKPVEKSDAKNAAGGELDLTDLVQLASAEGMDTSTLEGDVQEVARAIDIGESGGDYGALLGFTNRPGRKFDDVDITSKTINELLDFTSPEGQYGAFSKRAVGRVATPMGRYQIVGKTLRGLKNELGLTGDEVFTPELQDQLFLQLLRRRGYDEYKAGNISKEAFLSRVSNEWEGLTKSKKSFNALVAAL